ncbi:MAG: hypothetical protein ACRDG6_13530 [Candidatus Limnocylindria bacterium]
MGALKMLAVLIAALGMAAVESVRPTSAKDEDDIALFVGSAHPLPAAKLPISRRGR